MAVNDDAANSAERAPEHPATPQVSRRKLLRGGLAATPVLLTVVSSPVMATGGNCTKASAFASINASRPDLVSTCSGKPPSWWCNSSNASYWPTSKYWQSKLFSDCFTSYAPCNGKTLQQVLLFGASSGNDCVAKHVVAAVLNAATSRTLGVLDEGTVKSIWTQFVAGGQYRYVPTPGITWYADTSSPSDPRGGLTAWLKTTMP